MLPAVSRRRCSQPPDGRLQVLVTGSYRLTAYDVENETVWWVGGLTWQLKPTPVMGKDTIYVLGWAGGADEGQQENVPPFAEVLQSWDKNHDGKLSQDEIPDQKITKAWAETDLDGDGFLDARDWRFYQSKRSVQNRVNAFRLGGHGDMTEKNFLWRYTKSLPNVPSPLLYENVLYLVKEGGILTALDPASGKVLKQGRLTGAPGAYFSSPVAADGKLFTISEEGKAVVLKPGATGKSSRSTRSKMNATRRRPWWTDESIYAPTQPFGVSGSATDAHAERVVFAAAARPYFVGIRSHTGPRRAPAYMPCPNNSSKKPSSRLITRCITRSNSCSVLGSGVSSSVSAPCCLSGPQSARFITSNLHV